MADYSYLSASHRKQPAPYYKLEGEILYSGKYLIPLFWYVLYSPEDIHYPQFEPNDQSPYWYRDQPPYYITELKKAVFRLDSRKNTLFRLLNEDQKNLYLHFSHKIKKLNYPYLHLYANNIAQDYEFGILKKKMNDLTHHFEKYSAAMTSIDLLFSPAAYELKTDPKSFLLSQLNPIYLLRIMQHKYWDWKGISVYDRDTYPIRIEEDTTPLTQYDLIGIEE